MAMLTLPLTVVVSAVIRACIAEGDLCMMVMRSSMTVMRFTVVRACFAQVPMSMAIGIGPIVPVMMTLVVVGSIMMRACAAAREVVVCVGLLHNVGSVLPVSITVMMPRWA